MCGIIATTNSHYAEEMIGKVSHRGTEEPYLTKVGKYTVGFVRLPITDLHAPKPPFQNTWLNGYISNYKELAEKYNIKLETNCDTELLGKFLNKFKGEKLDELNGFFSVVYYDGELKYFTDRYGIKQLYTYEDEDFYLASEVKALPVKEKDPEAIEDWFYSLGIMTDHTIWKGVKRVPCLPFPKPDKIDISYEAAKDGLYDYLLKSFKRNYYITAGVMLSGGVDSGILAKYLNPFYCFSMDYQGGKSEIENIKINSRAKHFTIIHNPTTLPNYLPETKYFLDDLKAGSCYTNYALFELAQKFTRVVYSGAGADEIFKGYTHRYNRPINEVIKRTTREGKQYDITHEEYDWRFLKGILVVEDRCAGAHAIETRYPFLDNDFVNFALSLPDEYLENKRILKDISGLPRQITEGKKRGFSNPITNETWCELLVE